LVSCHYNLPRGLRGRDHCPLPVRRGFRAVSLDEEPRKRRVIDTSAGDARRAVADAVRSLQPLREQVALIAARAERPLAAAERQRLCQQCENVERICQEVRVALRERLMDAPHKVVSHSRVTDVEKALDNLEAATSAALTVCARCSSSVAEDLVTPTPMSSTCGCGVARGSVARQSNVSHIIS
jgi:hypothetical protein